MTVTIGRRELLAAVGGAAMAWPLAARAQQAAMPLVEFRRDASFPEPDANHRLTAFRQGMKEPGYVEEPSVGLKLHAEEVARASPSASRARASHTACLIRPRSRKTAARPLPSASPVVRAARCGSGMPTTPAFRRAVPWAAGIRDRAKADGGGCDSLSTRTSVRSGIDAPVTQQWKVNWVRVSATARKLRV